MKKFFVICVALIAFLATNASGGNQYQTDQLRTCIVQATPNNMPVYNFVAQTDLTPVIIVAALPANQVALAYYSTLETDGWRAPYWVPSLLAVCNDNLNVNDSNYNIRLNRKLNNYPGEYGFTHNIRSTARHVFVIFS